MELHLMMMKYSLNKIFFKLKPKISLNGQSSNNFSHFSSKIQ